MDFLQGANGQMITIGFLVVASSMTAMAMAARPPYWVQIMPLAVLGISIIATKTIWTNAFFQILIDRYIGLNAGMNSATLLVGGALGGVLTTELLAQFGQSAFVRQSTSLTIYLLNVIIILAVIATIILVIEFWIWLLALGLVGVVIFMIRGNLQELRR